MNQRTFLIAILWLSFTSFLPAQQYEWVQSLAGTSNEYLFDHETDAAGNSYLIGYFVDNVTFGNTTLTTQSNQNCFVASLDKNGNARWAMQIPAPGGATNGGHLALGPNGQLYIAGRVYKEAYLGGDTLRSTAQFSNNNFIALLDTAGNYYWSRMMNSDFANQFVDGLETDPNGNAILTGQYIDSLYFHNGTILPGKTGFKTFVAKYDPLGNLTWSFGYGKEGLRTQVKDLSVDAQGNSYLVGTSNDTIIFGGNAPAAPGIWILKLNASGSPVWVQTQRTDSETRYQHIEADAAGNTWVLSHYTDTLYLGGQTYQDPGGGIDNVMLAQYNANGSLQYAKSLEPSGQTFAQSFDLIGDSLLSMVLYARDSLSLDSARLQDRGNAVFGDFYLATTDLNGNLQWIKQVDDGGLLYVNTYNLSHDGQGNLYFSGQVNSTQFLNFDSIQVIGQGANDFLFGKVRSPEKINTISGKVFRDWNNNGVQDQNEAGIPGIGIQVTPGNNVFFTDQMGHFNIFTDTGSYTLSLPNIPRYYSLSPTNHTAVFSGYQQIDSNNVFALLPTANVQDLAVLVTPRTPVRPGRTAVFHVNYENLGTIDMSGFVRVVHDARLNFTNSFPNPDTINGDTLSWNFSNLTTGSTSLISLGLQPDTSVQAGTSVTVEAALFPVVGDSFPADNFSGIEPVVVASYDPNDKQVFPAGPLTPDQIANRDWLSYLIRFQNTGNDTAFVVKIRDTLSSALDWSTFDMQAASHPYTLGIRGGNRIEWVFDNILLPDSFTNEPGSHGFVRFRIKPVAGLNVGDEINNRAGIFFDFNAPIITNFATTRIEVLTAVDPSQPGEPLELRFYPNPSRGSLTLEGMLKEKGEVELSLLNLQGQVVKSWAWDGKAGTFKQSLELPGVSEGIYLLQFRQGAFQGSKKLILRR